MRAGSSPNKEYQPDSWGGALSGMGVACACALGGGEGRGECHLGALGSCKALLSELYQRWPESLGFLLFLLTSVTWGHRFSQNALHCEHLSAGGGHPTSEQGPGGVSITAFFKNKPGAAVDVGLTVCMCRDKCL